MDTPTVHMCEVPSPFSRHSLQSPLPTSTPRPTVPYVAPPATRLFPTEHPTQSQSFSFSPTRIGHTADLLSLLALFIILYRTYHYVNQRRSGLVGPSAAPRLLKFWSLYGIIESTLQLLSLYLSPLQAEWLISATRALILLLLITGPRLPLAQLLYDRTLRPFFDTQAPEIERQFARARTHWEEVNEAFRELATYLLKRIAVGGLSNAVALPSAEEESHPAYVQHTANSNRDRGAPLPKETAVFPTARTFFAGHAEQRAETVINADAANLGGTVQASIPEAPRPLYDDARAMRERFRNRLKNVKSVKDTPR